MNPELHAVASFRQRYDAAIRRAWQRARVDLDFELAPAVFSLRLYDAYEAVFGAGEPARRRGSRFIDALHATDLYLAAAANNSDPSAVALVRRWYGPLLARDGASDRRVKLAEQMLDGDAPAAPLARYLGLCPLNRWLKASVVRLTTPPVPSREVVELAVDDAELRHAVDVAPGRVLARLSTGERIALVLDEQRDVSAARAAALAGWSKRGWRGRRRRLARELAREVDRMLVADGRPHRARGLAWRAVATGIGAQDRGRTDVAARLLRNAAIRGLSVPPSEPCFELNVMLAVLEAGEIERHVDVTRDEVLDHAARCWPCLRVVAVAGDGSVPPQARRYVPAIAAAAVIALAVVGSTQREHLRSFFAPAAAPTDAAPAAADAAPAATAPAGAAPTTTATAGATPAAGAVRAEDAITTSSRADLAAGSGPRQARRERSVPGAALAGAPRERDRLPARSPTPKQVAPAPPEREPRRGAVPATAPGPVAARAAAVLPISSPTRPPTPLPAASLPVQKPAEPAAAGPTVVAAAPAPREPSLSTIDAGTPAARLVNLAVRRYRVGEERAALDVVRRALDLEPGLAEAHLNCAVLLERLGDRRRAVTHWRRYSQLAPAGPHAAFARARLSD